MLLSIYTQRPSVWERVENGEKINYVILLVGIIGLVVSVYQFFYLIVVRRKVAHQLQHLDRPMRDNPLGRVLATFRGDAESLEDDVEVVELRISEAVLGGAKVERFQGSCASTSRPSAARTGRNCVGMIIKFQASPSGLLRPKIWPTVSVPAMMGLLASASRSRCVLNAATGPCRAACAGARRAEQRPAPEHIGERRACQA